MSQRIREAGGEIYAITSEPERLAAQARSEWALDFETIGDPHHEISEACRDAGLLQIIVNPDTARFEEEEASPYRHPKGYFQPGVLALTADRRVLYRWRSRPTRKNMGGAIHRPTADHVFDRIAHALSTSSTSETWVDAELDLDPKIDSRGMPFWLVLMLQIANGWFLRPVTFGQGFGGRSVAVRMRLAALKSVLFIAAWIGAFIFLPAAWVGAALGGWIIWIAPKVRAISKQYQPDLSEP